ncbi:MAG: hypothetical protein CMH57_02700 [Myxococcales bacterium]|nr:hypothetical protein [Myxococcales bacterium]
MAEYTWALKVVGYGDPGASSATDKRYRLATRALNSDPDSLYIAGALESYPKEVSMELGFKSQLIKGGETEFALGGSYATTRVVLSAFGRYSRATSKLGELVADIGPTDTTIDTNVSGLDDTLVHCGLESIYLGTETGTAGRYANCVREVLGTIARRHLYRGARSLYGTLPVIYGRPVELVRVPLGGGYDDEEVRWAGVITRRLIGRMGVMLRATHHLSVLEAAEILGEGRWRGETGRASKWRVGFGEGRASAGGIEKGHLPAAGPETSSLTQRMMLSIDGKVGVEAYWTGQGSGITGVRWGAQWGLPDPNLSELDVDPDETIPEGVACWEYFVLNPQQQLQIVNRSTGTAQYLSSNPVRFVQQILTTTPGGGNGDYDLGVTYLGVAWPVNLLDTDSFDRAAVRFAGTEIKNMVLGFDGKPVKLMDLLKKIMLPLHSLLGIRAGKIAWVPFRDSIPYEGADAVIALVDHYGDGEPGDMDGNDEAGLDTVRAVREAQPGGVGPREVGLFNNTRQEFYPASASEIELDVSAFSDPPGFQEEAATRLSEAYNEPGPIIPVTAATEKGLAPGDLVAYSHPSCPAPDGTIGIDDATPVAAQVLSIRERRGEDLHHETVAVDLYLTGRGARNGAIAPCMSVVSYTAPGASGSGHHELVVEKNFFKTSGSEPLGRDSDAFEVGWRVSVVEEDLARVSSAHEGIEIKAIQQDTPSGYDTIQLNGAVSWGSPAAAGWVIRLGTEWSANAPTDKFAFMADANGAFTGSGNSAYTFSLEATPRLGGSEAYSGLAPIDEDAAPSSGGWPYDEAMLQRVCASIIETLTEITLQSCCYSMDARNPLLIHGNPTPLGIIFGWYKEKDITTMVVTLLVDGKTQDTVFELKLLNRLGNTGSYGEQTVTAGSSTSIEFEVTGLSRYEGMVWFLLKTVSDESSSGKLDIKNTESLYIQADRGDHLGSTVDLALAADTVYKLVHIDSAGDYADDSVLPQDALILYEGTETGLSGLVAQYYVWPAWGPELADGYSSAALPVAAQAVPIGHCEVYAIEIRETASRLLGPQLGLYRGGMEAAARTVRELTATLAWMERRRSTIYHAGPGAVGITPGSGYGLTDASPQVGVLQEFGRVTISRGADAGLALPFPEIWSCTVGNYRERRDILGNSLGYRQTTVVEGLVGVYTRDEEAREFTIELYLELIDVGGGNTVTGTIVRLPIVSTPVKWERNPIAQAPWLRLFNAKIVSARSRYEYKHHTARSLWPAHSPVVGLDALGLVEFKVTVEDDQAPTSNMRRLSVRARCSSDTAIEDSERPLAAFCPWGVAYRFRDP